MARRGWSTLGLAVLVLAGCDRFSNNAQGGGPQVMAGFGSQEPAGQQLAQGSGVTPGGAAPAIGMANGAAPSLDQLAEWERQDAGVQPTNALHAGPMHAPTPTQVPGGQLITTKGLMALIQGGAGVPVLVLDVLGNPQSQLPNAIPAAFASQAGDFNDAVQQQLGQMLMQLTQGNKQVPIVTYCAGPQCWMSYNAALRAIALGYKNVLWYRGGIEAWQRAMAGMAGVGGQPPAVNMPQPIAPPGTSGGPQYE